jgi:hypothetical protein
MASCSPSQQDADGIFGPAKATDKSLTSDLGQDGQNVIPDRHAAVGACGFNRQTMAYPGTNSEQAACLLRRVNVRGTGATAQPLPAWLVGNAGSDVSVTRAQFSDYLQRQGISEGDVPWASPGAAQLRYFVIHDTSSPERSQAQGFPSNMDGPAYSANNLAGWTGKITRQVNMIIGRDGRSRAFQDWGATRSLPATKLEMNSIAPEARAVFVHVENVQPRLKPDGSWPWIAPEPGFSAQQEQRLSLAYISASVAAGRWLIPAYHFNIDEGLPRVHDDPQNADLKSWVRQIEALVTEIRK